MLCCNQCYVERSRVELTLLAKKVYKNLGMGPYYIRAPQLENDFHGNGDGGKTSQNDPLRLGPRSFGSKLMDLDGLKVSHFQLTI